jgi:hypothetical protein
MSVMIEQNILYPCNNHSSIRVLTHRDSSYWSFDPLNGLQTFFRKTEFRVTMVWFDYWKPA